MQKSKLIISFVAIFIISIFFILGHYVFPKQLKIYSVEKVLLGNTSENIISWIPIMDEEHKNYWEKELKIKLPEINYDEQFIYLTKDRSIEKLSYFLLSKHLWSYNNTYQGEIEFSDVVENNTIFVHITDPILCKTLGD